MIEPIAHSASASGLPAQSYRAHIGGTEFSEGVAKGAVRRADEMLGHYRGAGAVHVAMRTTILDGATFHDLGKLDSDIQSALRQGRKARLPWDHIDAGVAHLSRCEARSAAWIVKAHHAPGLPSRGLHFTGANDRMLRGRRQDDIPLDRHQEQISRTDNFLEEMLASHESAVGYHVPSPSKEMHGLSVRLALSCLVDADHSDSAFADNGWTVPRSTAPRWKERLDHLDAYVARLQLQGGDRNASRQEFYDACRHGAVSAPMVACEGPVGIGKTTAVVAYLIRRAIETGARRLFVVAPYTAILSQTAKKLREALILDDERDHPDEVIAEHHHRADFDSISARDLALLWASPIVVTTAVQFFETLASNQPASLRKIHALPGSVIFLDEAHAALPTQLLPQNWKWLAELSESWNCSVVFASGSLARFWEIEDLVESPRIRLPEIVPVDLALALRVSEGRRIRYVSRARFANPEALIEAVVSTPGPRLVILNTVQSAAIVAQKMRERQDEVLHLSTALCPRDRERILEEVIERLKDTDESSQNWTLIATSLMEAGVDVSFRTGFRERFSVAALVQISGRVNRHREYAEGGEVHDFTVESSGGISAHPAAVSGVAALEELSKAGAFAGDADAAMLVTKALIWECRKRRGSFDGLVAAERAHDYPAVAKLGRVIDADTRLVVVDDELRGRIERREKIGSRDLLSGSVQLVSNKIESMRLEPLRGRDDVYWWPHAYDANFLGYMKGALLLVEIQEGRPLIV